MNQIARWTATILMFMLIGGIVTTGMWLGYTYFLPLNNYGTAPTIAAVVDFIIVLMLVVISLILTAAVLIHGVILLINGLISLFLKRAS